MSKLSRPVAAILAILFLAGALLVGYELIRNQALPPPTEGQQMKPDTISNASGLDPQIEREYDSSVKYDLATADPVPLKLSFHRETSEERRTRDSAIVMDSFSDTVFVSRGDLRTIAKWLKSTGKIVWMDTVKYRAAREWMKKYNQKKEGRNL